MHSASIFQTFGEHFPDIQWTFSKHFPNIFRTFLTTKQRNKAIALTFRISPIILYNIRSHPIYLSNTYIHSFWCHSLNIFLLNEAALQANILTGPVKVRHSSSHHSSQHTLCQPWYLLLHGLLHQQLTNLPTLGVACARSSSIMGHTGEESSRGMTRGVKWCWFNTFGRLKIQDVKLIIVLQEFKEKEIQRSAA